MNARTVTLSLTNDQVGRLLHLLDHEAVNAKNSLAGATNEKLRTMYNARGEFAVAVAEQARCAIGEGTVKVFSLGWKARAALAFIENGVTDSSEDAFIQANEHVVDFRPYHENGETLRKRPWYVTQGPRTCGYLRHPVTMHESLKAAIAAAQRCNKTTA
jgi:hypothetical protein